MLGTPPPGYNTAGINQQRPSSLAVPGAQGVPVQGTGRLWGAQPQMPSGGANTAGLGGVGTSSFTPPSSSPAVPSLPQGPGPSPPGYSTQQGDMQAIIQALFGRGQTQ
jgi:hypothetical protein